MRARSRRLVEVEQLGIEPARESLDIGGTEGVMTERISVADLNVLEISHRSVSGCRRPTICVVVIVIKRVPAASNISNRNFVSPMSGRLFDARVSMTVVRILICAPGRNGASQRTSSTPGAPIELESSR